MAQRTAGAGKSRSPRAKSQAATRTAAASTKSARTSTSTAKKSAAKQAATKKTGTKKVASKKATKKAPVKKTTAKKAPAKKAAAKKAPAKKTPVKKAAAKKAPAKKSAAKKAPAKKAPVKRSAAKKAPPTKAAAKKAVAKKTPVTKATVQKLAATKEPAKKAAPRPLKQAATAKVAKPSARGRKPLTPAERTEMKGVLLAERKRLDDEIATAVEDLNELLRDSGEGSGDDQADAGSKTFEREHEMSVANNSRDLLIQVEHALQRIADGTYGTCESCGLPIGKMRLEAFPRATLCVDCKQREERR